ncbi:hypothetical protein FS837_010024 [Tulasnella sp. UAMH 9824]|nr:hypothetical protein FS837_010024 [Tulasnella sp. UAMH 9824]
MSAGDSDASVGTRNDAEFVHLEGNKTQAIAFTIDGGATRVLNQNTVVTITNTTSYQNLLIQVVDAVVDTPFVWSSIRQPVLASKRFLILRVSNVKWLRPLAREQVHHPRISILPQYTALRVLRRGSVTAREGNNKTSCVHMVLTAIPRDFLLGARLAPTCGAHAVETRGTRRQA